MEHEYKKLNGWLLFFALLNVVLAVYMLIDVVNYINMVSGNAYGLEFLETISPGITAFAWIISITAGVYVLFILAHFVLIILRSRFFLLVYFLGVVINAVGLVIVNVMRANIFGRLVEHLPIMSFLMPSMGYYWFLTVLSVLFEALIFIYYTRSVRVRTYMGSEEYMKNCPLANLMQVPNDAAMPLFAPHYSKQNANDARETNVYAPAEGVMPAYKPEQAKPNEGDIAAAFASRLQPAQGAAAQAENEPATHIPKPTGPVPNKAAEYIYKPQHEEVAGKGFSQQAHHGASAPSSPMYGPVHAPPVKSREQETAESVASLERMFESFGSGLDITPHSAPTTGNIPTTQPPRAPQQNPLAAQQPVTPSISTTSVAKAPGALDEQGNSTSPEVRLPAGQSERGTASVTPPAAAPAHQLVGKDTVSPAGARAATVASVRSPQRGSTAGPVAFPAAGEPKLPWRQTPPTIAEQAPPPQTRTVPEVQGTDDLSAAKPQAIEKVDLQRPEPEMLVESANKIELDRTSESTGPAVFLEPESGEAQTNITAEAEPIQDIRPPVPLKAPAFPVVHDAPSIENTRPEPDNSTDAIREFLDSPWRQPKVPYTAGNMSETYVEYSIQPNVNESFDPTPPVKEKSVWDYDGPETPIQEGDAYIDIPVENTKQLIQDEQSFDTGLQEADAIREFLESPWRRPGVSNVQAEMAAGQDLTAELVSSTGFGSPSQEEIKTVMPAVHTQQQEQLPEAPVFEKTYRATVPAADGALAGSQTDPNNISQPQAGESFEPASPQEVPRQVVPPTPQAADRLAPDEIPQAPVVQEGSLPHTEQNVTVPGFQPLVPLERGTRAGGLPAEEARALTDSTQTLRKIGAPSGDTQQALRRGLKPMQIEHAVVPEPETEHMQATRRRTRRRLLSQDNPAEGETNNEQGTTAAPQPLPNRAFEEGGLRKLRADAPQQQNQTRLPSWKDKSQIGGEWGFDNVYISGESPPEQ